MSNLRGFDRFNTPSYNESWKYQTEQNELKKGELLQKLYDKMELLNNELEKVQQGSTTNVFFELIDEISALEDDIRYCEEFEPVQI
ncbi:hypothetical protein [Culicoidibacter larvae]|uniref:Uncharacterized protein n=1 Tax=Culicoidibacter larvae TaxID=2579976 RepID=A0A5R8Q9I3_9FIRM|nr:hypothetical protein [Culicoidibacter larvae]TLG72083.1 hypothetical protein FEZ08_09630 [Culicoidibacter larvae]